MEKLRQLKKARKNKTTKTKIDILSTAENITDDEPQSKYLIEEVSRFKQIWDVWCMILVLYVALVVPFRLSLDLEDNKGLTTFNIIMDLCFLVDIVLTFFTAYYDDKEGKKIKTHKEIAYKYLKAYFIVDVISIFPFEPIINTV